MLMILLLTILKLVPRADAIGKLCRLPNLTSLQHSQGDNFFPNGTLKQLCFHIIFIELDKFN